MNSSNMLRRDFTICLLKEQLRCLTKGTRTANLINWRGSHVKFSNVDNRLKLWDDSDYRKNGLIADGTDGSSHMDAVARLLAEHPEKKALTFLLCTDGVQIHKSNRKSAWPIFLVCEQIGLPHRFKKRNVILYGLWHGVGKPPLRGMLRMVQGEIDEVNEQGGIPVCNDGQEFDCLVGVTKVTADTIGKASSTNQVQFNGEEGCCHWLARGTNITTPKGGNVRSYASSIDPPATRRTHKRLVRHARKATESGTKVHGVKGTPPVSELRVLDREKEVVVDEMHGGYLGVAKTILGLWRKTLTDNQVNSITERMSLFKPPPLCNRPPENLELATWRSSTFRGWVFDFWFPCCTGIIRPELLHHFALFTEAFTILSATSIHPERDVDRARILIRNFQTDFTNHYCMLLEFAVFQSGDP
ncbi:hypothetical protein RvY_06670 [Ramazzottius varieornatus]|uniref:Uncharacterized protein n=1 Tax=Ramazzottius varieornatus TaxID=947166 RepID=A0A1D1UZE5_RAMVA|nr:hypothetical protein RvY_06670 [Ramazzottius varieornatus]